MTKSIKLYTIGEVSGIVNVPKDTIHNWIDRERGPYQPPEPFAVAGFGTNLVRLWSKDQVEQMIHEIADLKERQAEASRKYQEKMRKQKENGEKKVQARIAKLEAELAAAKAKLEKPKPAPKPTPRPMSHLHVEPPSDDAQAFYEEFERERQEKALQFLMRGQK